MISTTLTCLKAVLQAELVGADCTIANVSTDTRALDTQCLFVALKGEKFDGHHFIRTAKESGAAALLVDHRVDCDLPQLIVEDTKLALGNLGAWVKLQANVKSLALTGSCGKTSVKEMVAAIIAQQGQTLSTAGNFNNDIGVPLTLLRLEKSDDFAVIELGANHQGEIRYTANLVQPDIAMVTNLAAAHLEGFGSLAGITQAKGEIFEGLSAGGVAVVNIDSWGEQSWSALLHDKQVITVSSEHPHADFYAHSFQLNKDGCYQFTLRTPTGDLPITLSLPGKHQVINASLATAAAMQFPSISITMVQQGLASLSPVKGRGAISFPRQGLRLIDDSYNASVAAMKSAIDLLNGFEGDKVIVLADMAEMGAHSQAVHQEVADYLASAAIPTVITYGRASAVISDHCQGLHFNEKDALIAHVVNLMKTKQDVSVLVKGANGMKMSEVVRAIEEASAC